MTAKTKKELHAENVLLKEQLADMKTKFSELTEKYKNMQQNKLIPSFKCHMCSKNFDCSEDFKKHMIKHGDKSDTLTVTCVIQSTMKNGKCWLTRKPIPNSIVKNVIRLLIINY